MHFIFFEQCAHFNALYFRNEHVEQLCYVRSKITQNGHNNNNNDILCNYHYPNEQQTTTTRSHDSTNNTNKK